MASSISFIFGAGFPAISVCLVQGIDEHRLDLGTGQLFTGTGQ